MYTDTENTAYYVDASKCCSTKVTFNPDEVMVKVCESVYITSSTEPVTDAETKTKNYYCFKNSQTINLAKNNCASDGTCSPSASKHCLTKITSSNESAIDTETKTKNGYFVLNSQAMNFAYDNCASDGTSSPSASKHCLTKTTSCNESTIDTVTKTKNGSFVSVFDAESKKEETLVSKTEEKGTWETMTVEDYFTGDEWMLLMYEELFKENCM